ncbi:MAG: FliI/YscN family ATPase [Pseudomonadaceae bacterium]|nr:FliI/YscN family ATPase [Pseudomonadaceae bacterium]
MLLEAEAQRLASASNDIRSRRRYGRVNRVVGNALHVVGVDVGVGQLCEFQRGSSWHAAQIVGFSDGVSFATPLVDIDGLRPGAAVRRSAYDSLPCTDALVGRIVDGLGEPLDGGRPIPRSESRSEQFINPLQRGSIDEPVDVGVRAINGLLTVGRGQRVGLFAGSGVGKSVLLGMLARYTDADVVVVGLIGERGREVRDFVDDVLAEAQARAVVIAAPADEPALFRLRAARLAMATAESFAREGKNVLLLMDSLTRVAHAQREIGLSAGEPPTAKGYPPSVYALLPKLVERAGRFPESGGSVTAIFTVLTEEDDLQDPVVDASRAILDGHIVLRRSIADAGLYPAIDVHASLSRTMDGVVSKEQVDLARQFRRLWARYAEQEDLISVGAYRRGEDALTDRAIDLREAMNSYVAQPMHEQVRLDASVSHLKSLLAQNSNVVATTNAVPNE